MPPNLMSSHQRSQGYAPSPDSMFAPQSPQQDGTPNALLFQPIGVTEVPSKPDTHLGVVPWPNQPPRSRGPSPVPGFASMRNSPYPDPKGGPLQLPTSSHYQSGPGHPRQNSIVTPGQLRKVALPTSTFSRFLSIAALNTSQKRETCGLLLGRPSRAGFEISTLLVPKQTATESTCSMTNEELVAEVQEKRGLMTLGWVRQLQWHWNQLTSSAVRSTLIQPSLALCPRLIFIPILDTKVLYLRPWPLCAHQTILLGTYHFHLS